MAKKRAGWEGMFYRGAAGSTASTLVSANVVNLDPGVGGFDFIDQPTRGDGTTLPQMDEQPVKRNAAPTLTMVYYDTDANIAAFLAAADASAPTAVAVKYVRYNGGDTQFDGDVYVEYSAPGEIANGQEVSFTFHPTSAGGRAWATS